MSTNATFIADTVRRFIPWSHSKVQLAEKCPKAFKKKYVDRSGSKEGPEARVGTAAHAYLEHRLDPKLHDEAVAVAIAQHKAAEELPAAIEGISKMLALQKAKTAVKGMTTLELETLHERNTSSEEYIKRTEAFRNKSLVRHEGYEVDLAIRMDGSPCDYEDSDALIRGSIDHLIEQVDYKALIIDHKSGKTKTLDKYMAQLNTYKVLTVQNRPHLRSAQAGVHHIQDASLIWQRADSKEQVQRVLLPWLVRRIEQAALSLDGYPAKVTALCPWCDYHLQCEEGLASCSAEEAQKKRDKSQARNLGKKEPRTKKDGTPYATRKGADPALARQAHLAAEAEHAELGSVADMFADDEVIL